jgi:hypothetical protein
LYGRGNPVKNKTLSYDDKDLIKDDNFAYEAVQNGLERANRLKLGDYVVAFSYYKNEFDLDTKPILRINRLKMPVKFQVTYVSDINIPYVQRLNPKGQPYGDLLSTIDFYSCKDDEIVYYEVDPDYADAIIFQNSENFDPIEAQRAKTNLAKEIRKHNDLIRIHSSDELKLAKFIAALPIGTVIWRSYTKHFTINKVMPVNTNKYYISNKSMIQIILEIIESNGSPKALRLCDLLDKRLYTSQPRSLQELEN